MCVDQLVLYDLTLQEKKRGEEKTGKVGLPTAEKKRAEKPAFPPPPPGRPPLVRAGAPRLRTPLLAPSAGRGTPREGPATPHRTAWTCRSGWGRLQPQG